MSLSDDVSLDSSRLHAVLFSVPSENIWLCDADVYPVKSFDDVPLLPTWRAHNVVGLSTTAPAFRAGSMRPA